MVLLVGFCKRRRQLCTSFSHLTLLFLSFISFSFSPPLQYKKSLFCYITYVGVNVNMDDENEFLFIFTYKTIVDEIFDDEFTTMCIIIYIILDIILWFSIPILRKNLNQELITKINTK